MNLSRLVLVSVAVLSLLPVEAASPAPTSSGVEPRFDLTDPGGAPFPSDRSTLPDESQLTGLRVNLPAPDCSTNTSDCDDIDVLNTLDGFNLQPRLSIPFTAPIDLSTVSSDSIFVCRLEGTVCPGQGSVVGINQLVWDPERNVLHAESDRLLDQHTGYLLVVTNDIRDLVGDRIGHDQFSDVLHSGSAYTDRLLAAVRGLDEIGIPPGHVAAASIFTTQSATAVMEKIRDQLTAAPPAAVDFLLGTNGERTVFPLADITNIAFRRQTGTAPTFRSSSLPLSQLEVVPGAVAAIAFGRYRAPDYETDAGVIPPIGTADGTPTPQRTNDVYFNLYLPTGAEPVGGWPVVIAGYGMGNNKNGALLATVAKLAQHGLATILINWVGHGGGALGTLTVAQTHLGTVTLPAGGRGVDRNADGAIEPNEGFITPPGGPLAIVFARDGLRQTVVDLMQLVRELQVGIDVDGDSTRDLNPARIYYHGASLGGLIGTDLVALEPSVRAGSFTVTGGLLAEIARLSIPLRPLLGELLGLHVPSLLNGGPDPINFATNPTPNPFPFRDNQPLRDQPAIVNDVPGAMPIQDEIERIEWAGQSADPVGYAPHLRQEPLAGREPKPVLYVFAQGDWSMPNPTTSAILRAGGLADRATLFRFDLAYAQNSAIGTNPHQFLAEAGSAVALQGKEQIATFLASDGQVTIDPDGSEPLFETPIAGPLLETICYMPFQLPCTS